MSQPSERITKYLIIFIVGVIILKGLTGSGFFESKTHKGRGFVASIPPGWKLVKKEKGVVYPRGVEIALFVPKGMDTEEKSPSIFISIYSKKLTTPIWVEDEFPEILQSISQSGFQIMDKGEIKVSGVISKWVVYHDKQTPALALEFYLVTDNSIFYKLQYSAHPDQFNQNRAAFEFLKESFQLKFSLF